MGADRFSDEVLDHCSRTFRGQATFEDYGDPAGGIRSQTDERTCFEILQAKGIMIEPGLQTPTIRIESVRRPLRTIAGGEVQLAVHPRCKTLRKAFLGGYHYRRMATHSERYTTEPDKNHPFSDIMDSVEYVATILFGAGLTDAQAGDRGDFPVNRGSLITMGGLGRSKVTGY